MAEELALASNNAVQLLDLVENDRLTEAAPRARDLTSALSEIRYRRSPYLEGRDSDELLTQRTQVQIIEEELSSHKSKAITQTQRQLWLMACRRSSNTLKEILGKVKQTLEVGGTS